MLFPSFSFLFLFLPIVLIGYYLLPKGIRNIFLLGASLIFYGWDKPSLVALLISVVFLNYIGALLLDHFTRFKKSILAFFIVLNVGLLGYFKYTNFLVNVFTQIVGVHYNIADVILPLGISFYIFQAMSYLIDVSRGVCPAQKNPFQFALYISFFPQLIAGPIIKYHQIAPQIENRTETWDRVYYGIRRFIIGLAKKVLLGNTLGITVDKIFELPVAEFGTGIAWIGILFYALQIYYDFSGYSDMAVGLGAMFGFKIPENFNYPLMSKTLSEYWQRWHISLGQWAKEYIYIPLGGSRCSPVRHYVNLFLVFFLIGLWHGASWNFIIFGIYCGVVVVLEKICRLTEPVAGWKRILYHLYFVFVLTWLTLFGPAKDAQYIWDYARRLLGVFPINHIDFHWAYFLNNYQIIVCVIGLVCAFPIFKKMLDQKGILKNAGIDLYLLGLFGLCVVSLLTSSYNPFIYFRF